MQVPLKARGHLIPGNWSLLPDMTARDQICVPYRVEGVPDYWAASPTPFYLYLLWVINIFLYLWRFVLCLGYIFDPSAVTKLLPALLASCSVAAFARPLGPLQKHVFLCRGNCYARSGNRRRWSQEGRPRHWVTAAKVLLCFRSTASSVEPPRVPSAPSVSLGSLDLVFSSTSMFPRTGCRGQGASLGACRKIPA